MAQTLRLLPGELAVWKLPADAAPPPLPDGAFGSLTRTAEELSGVSPAAEAPPGAAVEAGWRCLAVEGPLAFELTGVLASLAAPLADAGVPIFVISTHDTDYLLLKSRDLERARAALDRAGHRVRG